MNPDSLQRLKEHAQHLALVLLREANPDGIIRTLQSDGSALPDLPATHHLVEVLERLDPDLFASGIAAASAWMSAPENQCAGNPFALEALAAHVKGDAEYRSTFQSEVAARQLPDGSIPIFTAYLPGGDFFSTLWAVKVMAHYDRALFASEIEAALDYLVNRRGVGTTAVSQIGFLGLLLAKLAPDKRGLIGEIAATAADRLRDVRGKPERTVERLFLIEDLHAMNRIVGGYDAELQVHLSEVFALDEPVGMPKVLTAARDHYGDSLFLETLARAAVVAIDACRDSGVTDIGLRVNAMVHSDYRETRYKALQTTAALRQFLERYGAIHGAFEAYNHKLEEAWKQSPFERTIFLMMPFLEDERYRALTAALKAACAKAGYRAIRVDDPDRRFADTLWDNLVVNMLSARAAIAVYVSQPVVDALARSEVRLFANPNVALEYGFFKSRGHDVLLLKDQNSPVPTDLQGFLWHGFDIATPSQTVTRHVETWLAGLEPEHPSSS